VDFDGQMRLMQVFENDGAPWAVRGYEVFNTTGTSASASGIQTQCLSMQLLGKSIRQIRQERYTPFSLTTLASIGIQMLDIIRDLHERYSLYHADIHAGNWVVRLDNPNKISLIDYGYMKNLTNHDDRVSEIKELVITLRWLVDMNDQYYAPKHIPVGATMDDICPMGLIPSALRRVVEYVYTSPGNATDIYDHIRATLIGILEAEGYIYNNEIIFDQSIRPSKGVHIRTMNLTHSKTIETENSVGGERDKPPKRIASTDSMFRENVVKSAEIPPYSYPAFSLLFVISFL
jgi:hypothetical protein